jgi:hypothetical protein
MESIKKYVELEKNINLKMIKMKEEPTEKIKKIYNMIKKEIEDEIVEMTLSNDLIVNEKYGVHMLLSGGSISDLFIENYEGETKDYDFFIHNDRVGYIQEGNSHTNIKLGNIIEVKYKDESELQTFNDKETDEYGRFFKTKNIYKIKRKLNGEEVSIDLIVSKDFDLEFDLAFREFYYNGEKIEASARAVRDIKNNQISVNSLKTPRQTYYRMKEYEERFGMVASPVEKHILIKEILYGIETENKTMDFKNMTKTKYYTEEREKAFHKEKNELLLTHDVYTPLLKETLRTDTQEIVSVALEKARLLYELGFKEDDFKEPLKIKMPKWELEEEVKKQYKEIKEIMIQALKKYNKERRMDFIYAEEDEKDEWLRGSFNDILCGLYQNDPSSFVRPQQIRFALFFDDKVSSENKNAVDEQSNSYYLRSKNKAKEMIKEKEMEFTLKINSLYEKNESRITWTSFGDSIFLEGETGVGISINSESRIILYGYRYGYLDKQRMELLKGKLLPLLDGISTKDSSKYRHH